MNRLKGKNKWTVLKHNGPYFPPEYIQHNIHIIVNGKEIKLNKLAEEYATLYSRYIDTDYVKNYRFNKNFWKDFKKVLSNDIKIDKLEDIDFSYIKKHLDNQREKRLSLTKEEKERRKNKQQKIEEPYQYCVIDGSRQKVGNYKIEPPGIFLGRGTHPKIGMIKRRIYPEDVTINLDKETAIPKPNIEGHNWGKVIHDRKVIWLASWKDPITGKAKYVFTSVESLFKSNSDEKKFDLAKKLKRKAASIREQYENQLTDQDIITKQLATALYFIDRFALRVGAKKNIKKKADTVGVTSLRVEHISLLPPNTIKLDFLGKDSIRYCKKTQVISPIYDNLKEFIINKDRKEQLFDKITASSLNQYLDSFMKGLTAKVWRTYNASFLFQKELDKIKPEKIEKIDESQRMNYLLTLFHQANTAVALLCNHQKSATSNIDSQIERYNNRIKLLKKKIRKYKEKKKKEYLSKAQAMLKVIRLKKETKMKMKNVSLSTSKNNYIDPRIIFAFIKKFDIPVEKIFTASLLKRFEWASKVDKGFRF